MPRNAGVAASISLFCLLFFPFPLLALQLHIPTRSFDGTTVYVTWDENDGDPSTVFMQIICGQFRYPQPPNQAHVSDHKKTFMELPWFSAQTSPVDCNIYAFEKPYGDKKIAKSENFRTLAVAPIESKETHTATPSTETPPVATPSLPPTSLKNTPSTSIISKNPTSTNPTHSNQTTLFITTPFTPRPPLPEAAASSTTSPGGPDVVPSPRASDTITTSSEGHGSAHQTSHQGAIIGGVLGSLAFLALLLGLGFLCYRRRRGRLPPSATYYTANDRNDYNAINNANRQNDQYRPDVKRNTDYDAAENGTQETAEEAALRRKAEIMDDLIYEAAARDGVKA